MRIIDVKVTKPDGSTTIEKWEVIEINGVEYLKPPTSPYVPQAGVTISVEVENL